MQEAYLYTHASPVSYQLRPYVSPYNSMCIRWTI